MSRIEAYYKEQVIPQLFEEFGYKNLMQVPKVVKTVLNMGVGEAIQNIKVLDAAAEELTMIAGQKALINKAKRSIASFKLREGMPIGTSVTLGLRACGTSWTSSCMWLCPGCATSGE
jgi:large subunit ribosomal protein L5